jgi:hypothetical protein
MTIVADFPMPGIATSRERDFARIPVDSGQTSLFEGREFRFVRKISTPIVYRFTAPIEFILSSQKFNIVDGEFEFYAWRDDNVTPSGTWTSEPIFSKNSSLTRRLYDGSFYAGQCTIDSGGSISVIDNNLYSDYERLKTANSTAQRISVVDQTTEGRYLAAGTYYLQFTGTADASFKLEWEERT